MGAPDATSFQAEASLNYSFPMAGKLLESSTALLP